MAKSKRADGRYVKKVTLPGGVKKYVYGKSQQEVNQKAREMLNAADSGIDVTDNTTVGEWAKAWFNTYVADKQSHTKAMYANAYNVHILPYLGAMCLHDVLPIHAKDVMLKVSKKSESMQRKVLITMQQIFSTAIDNGMIGKNPADGLKITQINAPEKVKFLTDEQQDQLMDTVEEPRARAFCALCMYLGLRREEALGAMWTDIEGGQLTVRRAVTFIRNQPDPDTSLKSKASARVLPVPKAARDILAVTPKTSLYIVPSARGTVMTKSAIRRMWDIHVSGNVNFEVHPHKLRHTYASLLHSAGVDLKTAQYLMGHSDIKMTADIYTHLDALETAGKAVTKIDDFLRGCQIGCQNAGNIQIEQYIG